MIPTALSIATFSLALVLAIRPWLWHVNLIRANSGPLVGAAIAALPFAAAAAAALLHRVRRPRLEPWVLLALPLLICLVRLPLPTLVGAAWFCSAWTIGFHALRRPPVSAPLRIALRFGFGVSVHILVLFAAGLAGWVHPAVTALLLAPALAAWPLLDEVKSLAERYASADDIYHPAVSVVLLFAAAFVSIAALWAITPAISYDPMKMHLANARWYVETGSFQPSPVSPESIFPQGAELLMAALWTLSGQSAAQLVSPVFFLASLLPAAAVLRAAGLSRAATFCGLTAAAAIPFLHWTGSVAKNDTLLAFFLLAALASLLDDRPVLASFFLAMAFGIKHIALFGAVALTPLFLQRIWRSRRPARTFAAVAAVFLAFGLLSLVRAYALTGNPLYPESAGRAADIAVNRPSRYSNTTDRVWRYVSAPWLFHFDGFRAFESASPNPMGLWLVFFFPFLFHRPANPARRAALLFCAIYILYWISILVTLRYAIAPIILLTALSAAGLFRPPRLLAAAAALVALSFGLTVTLMNEVSAAQILWYARRLDDDAFLRRMLPHYPATRALADHARPGDLTLALDGCAVPYAPYPAAVRCFDQKDFDRPRHIGVLAQIRHHGYRFLILPRQPVREAVLAALPHHRLLFEDANTALYAVR
jgi:hypothetical protein